MIVVPPYEWNPSEDITSNLPQDAWEPWSGSNRYAKGETVTTSGKLWRAAVGVALPLSSNSAYPVIYNENRDPTARTEIPVGYVGAGTMWWEDVTANGFVENRYRMFSQNPAEVTISSSDIVVELAPSEEWDSVALFNVGADLLEVTLLNGPTPLVITKTLRHTSPISPYFPNQMSVALTSFPLVDPVSYPGASLLVRLSATVPRIIHCGYLAVGKRAEIGLTVYGTSVGIVDYSRKERDTWGNMQIIERGYADIVRYQFEIETATVGEARQFLADRRAKLTIFIGHPDASGTIVCGWYKDLILPVEEWHISHADLEVESIVQETPASTQTLPTKTVFVQPNGTACITADAGSSAELCVMDGKIIGRVFATVLGYTREEGDSIAWEMSWLSGSSSAEFRVTSLSTGCDQQLSILFFPESYQPEQPGLAVASIRAAIVRSDESVIATEPAILLLKACDACDPGAPEPEPCCSPFPSSPIWLHNGLITETAIVKQYVEYDDPAPPPPTGPDDPDPSPPISCQVICYYRSTRTNRWEYFGGSGGMSNASYGRFFVAVRQIGGSEAYLSTSNYHLSVSGASKGVDGGGPHGIVGWYVNANWDVEPHHFTVSVTVNDPPGSTCGVGSFWWGL